jgi:hypothetical protein
MSDLFLLQLHLSYWILAEYQNTYIGLHVDFRHVVLGGASKQHCLMVSTSYLEFSWKMV